MNLRVSGILDHSLPSTSTTLLQRLDRLEKTLPLLEKEVLGLQEEIIKLRRLVGVGKS